MNRASIVCVVAFALPAGVFGQPSHTDASFDLRDYYGDGTTDYTTAVRQQFWGTCWIYGTTAAMESNLMMTGNWSAAGMDAEADLAEYHLDKFNGFTRKGMEEDEIPAKSWYTGQGPPFPGSNTDEPLSSRTHGLIVHLGGDYRIATAYLTNHGAINETAGTEVSANNYPDRRIEFGYSDADGIPRFDDEYVYFMPRHVEWHTLSGTDEQKRLRIKEALVAHGSVGTCMYSSGGFYADGSHYQPPEDVNQPNHAIAIIGWDDNKPTQADSPGAWLCRNSWGATWGEYNNGHFWISYYDKHTARHVEMGGVTFRQVEKVSFSTIYSHSLHGWQYDTGSDPDVTGAANRFVASRDERLKSVGFYSLAEDVSFTVRIHKAGLAGAAVSEIVGMAARPGFHMVDIEQVIGLSEGEVFFIAVEVDKGGYAFDASFVVHTAMGPTSQPPPDISQTESIGEGFYKFDAAGGSMAMGTITDPPYDVYSAAGADESFYRNPAAQWLDFAGYDAHNRVNTEWDDNSWNFAITGYAEEFDVGDINKDGVIDAKDFTILAGQWALSGDELSADVAPEPDGDDAVNGLDLRILADRWLR